MSDKIIEISITNISQLPRLNMPIEESYKLLENENCLAHFCRLVNYESRTYNLQRKLSSMLSEDDFSTIKKNFIFQEHVRKSSYDINKLSNEELYKLIHLEYDLGLFDVYGKDEYFLFNDVDNSNKDVRVYILLRNGIYLGHVYGWIQDNDKDSLQIMGIRTSLPNIYAKERGEGEKGIAESLIKGIIAKADDFETIKVIEPIGLMPKILKKLGFKLANHRLDYHYNLF